MKRQPMVYTLVFVRKPDPYWQQRFGAWLRAECEKEGIVVPSPAELAELAAARAKSTASD